MNRLRVRLGLPQIRSLRTLLLAVCVLCLLPMGAAALTVLPVTSTGPVWGQTDFEATVTATFSFEETCNGTTSSLCTLTLTLSYDSATDTSTSTPGAAVQSQVLAGLLFEPVGGASFSSGSGSSHLGGSVTATDGYAGSGAATAQGVLALDVSGHWGLNPKVNLAGYGSVALSSVGDILNFDGLPGGNPTVGAPGQIFAGPTALSLETPLDGSQFGIVDDASSPGGPGWPTNPPSGEIAYIQNQVVANLYYTGTLTGVDDVLPLFGTDGLPIPEPSTGILLGAGLLGLLGMRRRGGSHRS